jgi:hypothetical protein
MTALALEGLNFKPRLRVFSAIEGHQLSAHHALRQTDVLIRQRRHLGSLMVAINSNSIIGKRLSQTGFGFLVRIKCALSAEMKSENYKRGFTGTNQTGPGYELALHRNQHSKVRLLKRCVSARGLTRT